MGVWSNAKSFDKTTKDKFLRQAHPNVLLYRWIPNRQFFALTQPNERGSFFQPGSNSSDQNKPVPDEEIKVTQPTGPVLAGGTGTGSQIFRQPPIGTPSPWKPIGGVVAQSGVRRSPIAMVQPGNPGVYLGATTGLNWGAQSGGGAVGGRGRSSQL